MKKTRKWLTELRVKAGLTHQETADRVGIDRSFYTQIESGTRNPSVETAKAIAKVLKFEWTIFFDQQCRELQQKPKAG